MNTDDQPVPPTNACLIVGVEVVPLELVYDRRDEAGTHVWRVPQLVQIAATTEDVQFHCDALPPHTTVEVDWEVSTQHSRLRLERR